MEWARPLIIILYYILSFKILCAYKKQIEAKMRKPNI